MIKNVLSRWKISLLSQFQENKKESYRLEKNVYKISNSCFVFRACEEALKREMWKFIAKSCLTLCAPVDCSPPRLLYPWGFPGKNTGMGCHFLLQRIVPNQGSNLGLLLGRWILYHWATREDPQKLYNSIIKKATQLKHGQKSGNETSQKNIVNKHMWICSTSLVIKERQIKTTMWMRNKPIGTESNKDW